MTQLVQEIVSKEMRQGKGMAVNGPFTALATKWPVKRRATIATDSLRSGCRVLSVTACTTHNSDPCCFFRFAKYQNTGTPASITSVITIVPNSE